MSEAVTATPGNTIQPPTYRGDQEGPLKELGPEQRHILDLQLSDHARLNEMELHSDLRDGFVAGDTSIPSGTLLHGTSYSPEAVRSIAAHGVMSGELFDKPEDTETNYCADFWRVEKDTTIGDYCEEITGKEPGVGRLLTSRGERSWIPNPLTRDERMAVIIDPNIPEIQPLLEADAYRPGTDELFSGIINHLPAEKGSPKGERLAAILGGVPKGAIAGLLVSPKLAENPEHIADIVSAFEGKVPVLSITGELVAGLS